MFEEKALLNVHLSVVYFYTRKRFNYAKFKPAEAKRP